MQTLVNSLTYEHYNNQSLRLDFLCFCIYIRRIGRRLIGQQEQQNNWTLS